MRFEHPDDPSIAMPRPRARRPLPRLLDHGEIARLFATAEEEAGAGTHDGVRMLALLELLYGSGLRATELVSLPLVAMGVTLYRRAVPDIVLPAALCGLLGLPLGRTP